MAERALIVCPEAPYPLHGGGPLRTAAMLQYLARKYEVDGIFFREPGTPDPVPAIPAGLVKDSLTIELPFHSRSKMARVARNFRRYCAGRPPLVDRFRGFESKIEEFTRRRRYAVAVIEHFWCAPYVRTIQANHVIADLHNVESVWHTRMSTQELPWLHRRFAGAYRQLETDVLPRFDQVLVPSQADLTALPPGAKAAVYPNTVPAIPRPAVPKQDRIIFSANLEYHPNISGVAWFAREVWPALANRHPSLEWVLAGRSPEAVRHLAPNDTRIRFTGPVPDLVPEIAAAKVAIVPLHAGSGTRVKILEAWRAGTAVVSTPIGAEGLPQEGVVLAANPIDFAGAISTLLEDERRRHHLEGCGFNLLEAEFTWEAGWKCLERLGI